MSLFSDVDWVIILIIAGVLLLGGNNNKELLRTAGRMYAKVMRMRDEFLRDLKVSIDDVQTTTTPAVTHAGQWSVGTARTVQPISKEESQASLSKLTAPDQEALKQPEVAAS